MSSAVMLAERWKAVEAGEVRYQGQPCKHGHGTERYTLTNACVVCNRARVSAYQKRLREKVRRCRNNQQPTGESSG